MLLVVLSLGLQKMPVLVVRNLFRLEQKAQKAHSLTGHRTVKGPCKRKCHIHQLYAVFPWFLYSVCVIGSFLVTGFLTSKGLLGTNEFKETGAPCRCRGIAGGADVEADWLLLVCMVFVFKWLIYQPVALFLATCLHLREANKTAATMLKHQAGINVEMQHRGNGGGDTGEIKDDGNHLSTHVVNPMRVVAYRKSTASSRKENFHAPATVKGRGSSFRKCSCAEGDYYENIDTGETTWTLPTGSLLIGSGDGNDEDDLGGGAAILGEEDDCPTVLGDPEEVGGQNVN